MSGPQTSQRKIDESIVPLNRRQLAEKIASEPWLWQLAFMDASQMATFSRERGVPFDSHAILWLWRLGLFPADYVVADSKPVLKGFERCDAEYHKNFYSDLRPITTRRTGLAGVTGRGLKIPKGLRPFFHPFRYVILAFLDTVLDTHIVRAQFLYSADGFRRLLDDHIKFLSTWTASDSFISQLREAEAIARTAIALEPCLYSRISGYNRRPAFLGQERYWESHRRYSAELHVRLRKGQLDDMERIRGELCERAEDLDNNRISHTLIRLSKSDLREKLRGKIGGAVLLKTMAEIVRRCCEEAFEKELPEEDERNFGIWMSRGLKKELYGSNRLLDGDPKVTREFLRDLRLDCGPRLRWYVEGATEFACLDEMLRLYSISFVDLVNLRGQVIEKRAKGLALRDSLRSDIKNGIFSFVSFDGDKSENIRAVRKAAEDGHICGQFFISVPDFEFENFALAELEEILWALALENGADDSSKRSALHEAMEGIESSSLLIERARKALPHALPNFDKGPDWGRQLARFLLNNPNRPDTAKERQVVTAFFDAARTRIYSHHDVCTNIKADPTTGRWVRTDERGH